MFGLWHYIRGIDFVNSKRSLTLLFLTLSFLISVIVVPFSYAQVSNVFPTTTELKVGVDSSTFGECGVAVIDTNEIISSINNPDKWLYPANYNDTNSSEYKYMQAYNDAVNSEHGKFGVTVYESSSPVDPLEPNGVVDTTYQAIFYFTENENAVLQHDPSSTPQYLQATETSYAFFTVREAYTADGNCDVVMHSASPTPSTFIQVGAYTGVFGTGSKYSVYYSEYNKSSEVDGTIPTYDSNVSNLSFEYDVKGFDITLTNTSDLPDNQTCTWFIDNDPEDSDSFNNTEYNDVPCDQVINHTFFNTGYYQVALYSVVEGKTQTVSKNFNIDGSSYSGATSRRDGDNPNPYLEDCSAYGTNLIGGFNCVMGNFLKLLIDTFRSLFIPSSNVVTTTLNDLVDFWTDKLGFLAYPFVFLFDFFGAIGGGGDSCTQHFPGNFFGADGISLTPCVTVSPGMEDLLRLIATTATVTGLVFGFHRKYQGIINK